MKTNNKMSEQTRRDMVAYAIKEIRKAYAKNESYFVTYYYYRIAAYWQLDYVSETCYNRAFNMYCLKGEI